jgi:hypothetical protein
VQSETLILFPPFRLDVLNEQLWRDNALVPVRPKPFAVLAYLATHPGRLVTAAIPVKVGSFRGLSGFALIEACRGNAP